MEWERAREAVVSRGEQTCIPFCLCRSPTESLSQGVMLDIVTSLFFFFLLFSITCLPLLSLSIVSNFVYLSLFFYFPLPLFPDICSRRLPIGISVFLAFLFPSLSRLLLCLMAFHLPFCPCDQPISIYFSPASSQILLKSPLSVSLCTQFILCVGVYSLFHVILMALSRTCDMCRDCLCEA